MLEAAAQFTLTKLFLQRGIALTYLVAFLVAANQFRALLGERGLLPVPEFIKYFRFKDAPSLFYFFPHDTAFAIVAWVGVGLSLLALFGVTERFGTVASMIAWGLLWMLYLSFVNVGQTFYSFGWESILLEAGFFAIFLGGATTAAPVLVIWMFRWLLFRIMFGAGLIKLRGDPCWRDLTCLFYHFETQPMPNPLSWFFHWLPKWVHKGGVAFNHFVELIVPFGYFAPQPVAAIAGGFTIIFQGVLLISGNFSWLSFITAILAFATFDNRVISALTGMTPAAVAPVQFVHHTIVLWLAAFVVIVSYHPIRNLFSKRQAMNANYNPFHIVGTYGAFGSITRPRYEIVIEGTEEAALTPSTTWREYEFKGKPGDLKRMPGQFAPYHLRLDWLMWFAGFSSSPGEHPWIIRLCEKFLQNDAATMKLIKRNPFPGAPPRHVRARRYLYQFTTPAERRETKVWWKREFVHEYIRPVSLEDFK